MSQKKVFNEELETYISGVATLIVSCKFYSTTCFLGVKI